MARRQWHTTCFYSPAFMFWKNSSLYLPKGVDSKLQWELAYYYLHMPDFNDCFSFTISVLSAPEPKIQQIWMYLNWTVKSRDTHMKKFRYFNWTGKHDLAPVVNKRQVAAMSACLRHVAKLTVLVYWWGHYWCYLFLDQCNVGTSAAELDAPIGAFYDLWLWLLLFWSQAHLLSKYAPWYITD